MDVVPSGMGVCLVSLAQIFKRQYNMVAYGNGVVRSKEEAYEGGQLQRADVLACTEPRNR